MRGFNRGTGALALGLFDAGPELALVEPDQTDPVTWSHERRASPSIQRSLLLASRWIIAKGNYDGTWCGLQEGDSGIAARLLLTLVALDLVEGDRADRLADQLLADQLPAGGWGFQKAGEADLSVSVLAYLAIKTLRGPAALTRLRAARRVILGGGARPVSMRKPARGSPCFGKRS